MLGSYCNTTRLIYQTPLGYKGSYTAVYKVSLKPAPKVAASKRIYRFYDIVKPSIEFILLSLTSINGVFL